MPPDPVQLTIADLYNMFERGELSSSLYYRRHTLLAVTELAALAKHSHDASSRWRLKKFRAELERMEGNDEVEVTGEIVCETLLLAIEYMHSRRR
jgi:hypothetical protein